MALVQWNNSDKGSGIVISGTDNEIISCPTGNRGCRSDISFNSGKRYVEFDFTNISSTAYETEIGIATLSAGLENIAGGSSYGFVMDIDSAGDLRKVSNNSASVILAGSFGDGSIGMLAVDLDAGKVWFGCDGTWAGDPAAGTGEAYSSSTISSNDIYLIGSVTGASGYTILSLIPDTTNHTYSAPSGFDNGWNTSTIYEASILAGAGAGHGLGDNMGIVAGNVAAGETIEAKYSLANIGVFGAVGASANLDGYNTTERMLFDVQAAENIDAVKWVSGSISESTLSSSDILAAREVVASGAFNAGCGATFDIFNYSEFLRLYETIVVRRYFVTLTGSADGVDDIEIPVISISSQARNGWPTEATVKVPYDGFIDSVESRQSGQLIIQMAQVVGGVEYNREPFLVVDFQSYDYQKGQTDRTITINGSRTETHTPQNVSLSGITYSAFANGRIRCRASIDPYLRPGDTVSDGEITFSAGAISYTVNGPNQIMEVMEG